MTSTVVNSLSTVVTGVNNKFDWPIWSGYSSNNAGLIIMNLTINKRERKTLQFPPKQIFSQILE